MEEEGRKKDPGVSAPFIKFGHERRPILKQAHPDWKPADITRAMQEEWRNLPESEKERYKADYKRERDVWAEAHPGQSLWGPKKGKKERKQRGRENCGMLDQIVTLAIPGDVALLPIAVHPQNVDLIRRLDERLKAVSTGPVTAEFISELVRGELGLPPADPQFTMTTLL